MSKFIRSLFAAFLFFISVTTFAHDIDIRFQTPLEQADWIVKTSPFQCKITHFVSRFGYVTLEALPASDFTLSLVSDWFFKTKDNQDARAYVSYPEWKLGYPKRVYSLPMTWISKNKLSVHGNDVVHFLSGLETGLTWQFLLGDENEYLLTASAIKTQAASQKFLKCFYGLVPQPFSYIRNLDIYFGISSSELSTKGEQDIKAIAAYYKADKKVTKIIVDGYADNSGYHLANLALSRYRAENVTRRLIDLGVPQSIILTRFHGDRLFISSQKTKKEKSINRRVHIWVIKGNTKNV